MEENKKSYYAIIPATVRYDTNISANAKLLYGEITALCNEKGYCWATNDYFAKLYSVSKRTISRWIKELHENNYIGIKMIYKEGSEEIVYRYIQICQYPMEKNVNTPTDKINDTPIDKNVADNNTYNNNTYINNTINNNNIDTKNDKPKSNKKTKEVHKTEKNNFDELINQNFTDEELKNAIYEFIKMRKSIKKPFTEKGLELMIKKLYNLTTNIDEQIEIINNSIMNNWQGIFPLKKENNYKNNKGSFDDFKELWEEARLEDEQAGNSTNNSTYSW